MKRERARKRLPFNFWDSLFFATKIYFFKIFLKTVSLSNFLVQKNQS